MKLRLAGHLGKPRGARIPGAGVRPLASARQTPAMRLMVVLRGDPSDPSLIREPPESQPGTDPIAMRGQGAKAARHAPRVDASRRAARTTRRRATSKSRAGIWAQTLVGCPNRQESPGNPRVFAVVPGALMRAAIPLVVRGRGLSGFRPYTQEVAGSSPAPPTSMRYAPARAGLVGADGDRRRPRRRVRPRRPLRPRRIARANSHARQTRARALARAAVLSRCIPAPGPSRHGNACRSWGGGRAGGRRRPLSDGRYAARAGGPFERGRLPGCDASRLCPRRSAVTIRSSSALGRNSASIELLRPGA
jgi:hypothetical protein